MEKISKEEYLRALEVASQDDKDYQDDKDDGLGELSEAERLAAHADAPLIVNRQSKRVRN
jgi:hypothetical protein